VLARFDAQGTLEAVDPHHAGFVYLVRTMMKRISGLPQEVRDPYSLSSP
jgi:bile acid-coenzyme A ligase